MPISPREARKMFFFCLHFSAIRMGSRGTFVLFALQVPDVRGLQVPGPPCASFLLKFRSWNVIRTYTGILDCGLVPKPFSFS